jgi:HK97 family phage portal protein
MKAPLFSNLFERKSATAWNPLWSLITAYLQDSDGHGAVSADQAMRISAVNSCVRLISETVGSLPLHGYARQADGGRKRLDQTNSLETLLQKPNSYQTPMGFREQLTGHMLLQGNGFAFIDWRTALTKDQKVVEQAVGLYPIAPERMEVTWTADESEVRVPRYRLRRNIGEPMVLPNEEVLHLKGFSSDGLLGRSVLEDASELFSGALGTQRYSAHVYDNDATPGVVLKHPQRLNGPTAERIRKSWDDAHQGARNARRTAVLEEGMTIETVSMTPQDAQFIETRNFQRAEIAGLFRVPPHLIGDISRSTSWGTGIEQQTLGFLVFTIRPWLIRWEEEIQRSLILMENDIYVEHTTDALVTPDTATRIETQAKQISNGLLTPNEGRRLNNYDAMPGGEKLFRPANIVPIDTPAPAPSSNQPPPAEPGAPAEEKP